MIQKIIICSILTIGTLNASVPKENAQEKSAAQGAATLPSWQQPITKEQGAFFNTQVPGEIDITFDRENMPIFKQCDVCSRKGLYCQHVTRGEGYWASYQNPQEDQYKGQFPWPQAHDKPWQHQDEFLNALALLEKSARHRPFDLTAPAQGI